MSAWHLDEVMAPVAQPAHVLPAPASREVDVSVVLFHPDHAMLEALARGFSHRTPTLRRHLFLQDNGGEADLAARLEAQPALRPGEAFAAVSLERSHANLGFGRGHNANAARGRSPWLLVLNQDCELLPGTLDALVACAERSPDDVAAWELRQAPYEHPKAYDPATLETRWVSGAATLFRRSAFQQVGGFDPRLFMYAEDVDLSWRLRHRGWRLLYQPRLAVIHRTHARPNEAKPLQVVEGTLSNLCLRARHGGAGEVARGLGLLVRELFAPASFPRRRRRLAAVPWRFLARWPHFARTREPRRPELGHRFIGWDFEAHREGAFHAMEPGRFSQASAPLVSILIRTADRPRLLRQALACCAHQTYPNLEVVVVEDGPPRSQALVAELAQGMRVRYLASGIREGRARAGNRALAAARGEWLNFLDDDDLLFADHVEVLLDAALRAGTPAAFGLAWEARSRIGPEGDAREVSLALRHREPFDRLALWDHNFLPIQSVLFHRRLYERHGGFAEDMEQLEDWNLWTRYSLEDDFTRVAKTTSKYRVPDDPLEAAARLERLDRARLDAVARQRDMRASLPPPEVIRMATEFARSKRLGRRLLARVPLAQRVLRRIGRVD